MIEWMIKAWEDAKESIIQEILSRPDRKICNHVRGRLNINPKYCKRRQEVIQKQTELLSQGNNGIYMGTVISDIQCENCEAI